MPCAHNCSRKFLENVLQRVLLKKYLQEGVPQKGPQEASPLHNAVVAADCIVRCVAKRSQVRHSLTTVLRLCQICSDTNKVTM
jgi:hypothetical protein